MDVGKNAGWKEEQKRNRDIDGKDGRAGRTGDPQGAFKASV